MARSSAPIVSIWWAFPASRSAVKFGLPKLRARSG
jgi:hypothetical protein